MGPKDLFDIRTLLPDNLALAPIAGRAPAKGLATSKSENSTPRSQPPPSPKTESSAAETHAAWVRTDEDVVRFFAEFDDSTPVKFFFCNRVDQSTQFAPYDLVVVTQKKASYAEHFTISPRQVLRFAHGEICEAMPLKEWVWHKHCYNELRKKTFFSKYYLSKYYAIWSKRVRQAQLHRVLLKVEALAFLAKPAFCSGMGELGALMERLRGIKACGMKEGKVYRLGELVEQLVGWRMKKAKPEMEDVVGKIRKVAEKVCSVVEARAQAMRDSVKDPKELEDCIGVDVYASTTAARAKSMWVIKQEKIARAKEYRLAMQEVGMLPSFLRLVDTMLVQALGVMAVDSVASAVQVMQRSAAMAAAAAAAAAPAAVSRSSSRAGVRSPSPQGLAEAAVVPGSAGGVAGEGQGLLLFVDVAFGLDGTEFKPVLSAWEGMLGEHLVDAAVELAANVAPLSSLPVFAKYFAGAGQPEAITGGDVARGSPVFRASCQQLRSLLQRSYAEATAFAVHYNTHRPLYEFNKSFDLELYSQKQRSVLDLEEFQRDMSTLQQWRAQLDGMHVSTAMGCITLDAQALRAALEPMAEGALDQIRALLLQLSRDLCLERLEDLHLRLLVACARPAQVEDYIPWQEQVEQVQAEKDEVFRKAAVVDACYNMLAAFGAKIPTPDQVKHDDLRESLVKLEVELEGCAAFIKEQGPAHLEALKANATSIMDEAILLEEDLKHGKFVDEMEDAQVMVDDLTALVERLADIRAAADDVRTFQGLMGLAQLDFQEVADAQKEAEARLQLWGIVLKAQQRLAERESLLKLAARKAAITPEPIDGGSRPGTQQAVGSRLRPVSSLGSLESSLAAISVEAEKLQEQLATLGPEGPAAAVWQRAADLLQGCRMQLS